MEENTDSLKTILVAEDVDSNFLLLKALLGKTIIFFMPTMARKL